MASRSTNRTLAAALTRGDRSTIGRWFWTIDKTLLIIIFALVAAGIVAVAAASPAAARRLSGTALRFDDLYFLYRQLGWVALGLPLMLATSMLDMRLLKRLAVIGTLGCLVALLLVPFIGGGANGAARWIQLPGFQFQPSEFFKPCFIVTTAWLLSLKVEDRSLPTMQISLGLLGMALICLIAQPDVGQSALISAVGLTQAMLAGLSLTIVGALAGLGIVGLVAAYFTLDHFAARIDKWILGTGDTFQIDKALDCFRAGGWLGTGPGEGRMKFRLPEAQTDYIFSVIGEEFGLLGTLFLVTAIAIFLGAGFAISMRATSLFGRLVAIGITVWIGVQALINIGVTVGLLPTKGITLPFISYGGSSMMLSLMGVGVLVAVARDR